MEKHFTKHDVTHRYTRAVIQPPLPLSTAIDNARFNLYFVPENDMGLLCATFHITMACETESGVLKSLGTARTAGAERGNIHTGNVNKRRASPHH